MLLVQNFINKTVIQSLKTLLRLRKPGRRDPEGTLTSCCAVANHLLAEYASDEIITETVSEIEEMEQQPN